jgi:hypothetical protein
MSMLIDAEIVNVFVLAAVLEADLGPHRQREHRGGDLGHVLAGVFGRGRCWPSSGRLSGDAFDVLPGDGVGAGPERFRPCA